MDRDGTGGIVLAGAALLAAAVLTTWTGSGDATTALLMGVGAGGSALDRLTRQVERLREGEYDVDLTTDRDDEVGRLYEAVDAVAAELREHRGAADRCRRERDGERARRAALFEHATDAIARVTLDDGARVVAVNDRFEAAFEATEGALESILDPVGESDLPAAIGRGEAVDRELRLSTSDGTGTYRVRFVPVGVDGGPTEEGYVVCTDVTGREERERAERRRRELYDVTSDPSLSSEAKIRRLLEYGREWLGIDNGFLSNIDEDDGRYHVEMAVGDEFVDEGEEISLGNTFCRRAITSSDILGIYDAPEEGFGDDPGCAESGITCYIGARVVVAGELYGTFCFFDDEPTDTPFTPIERTLVDMMARWVSYELERREREHRLTALVENTTNQIFIKDREGRYQFVNQATADAFGYTREAMVGLTDEDLFDEESAAAIRADDRRVVETGETVTDDLVTTVDGEEHVFLTNKYPYEDPRGDTVGVMGISRDITRRVESERRLQAEKERFETLVRNLPGIVYHEDVEADAGMAFVSEGCVDLTGYEPATLERGDVLWDEDVVHPDDVERMLDEIRGAVAAGEPYQVTYRITTADGDQRWVWEQGRPVSGDDEDAAIEGYVTDVTERKRQELALESLHDATRELLGVDTEQGVADLVVETAALVLDGADVALYQFDPDANELVPVAETPSFADGAAPAVAADQDDSALWNCFVTGSPTVIDDPGTVENGHPLSADGGGGLLVPVGDHGVFVVETGAATPDDDARRLAETLAATTAAALDRLAREASLREQEAELEARNRRLERQVQVTDLIRTVGRSLVGAESREGIESGVCDRLAAADDVAFAWVGARDGDDGPLTPRAWAGDGGGYLDAVSLGPDGDEPSVRTARTGEPTVVDRVADRLTRESWREAAAGRGFGSAVSVPIAVDDRAFGVLTVYGTEPGTFGDLERNVFAELGESVADAIQSVNARRALHADSFVELRLGVDDDAVLGRIASETGATVTYEGLAGRDGEQYRLFVSTTGADPDAVEAALADLVAVTDYRRVAATEDDAVFEVTVGVEPLPSRLVAAGGRPRSVEADGGRLEVVVDVPAETDVRAFVDRLRERYDGVELRGRRDVERATHTREELVERLLEPLTDRQLEVLRTAYLAGFFEWPRESTGEEVADLLGVTQPTVNRHLRLGQGRLLAELFETARTG